MSSKDKKFYITTPIYYVNAEPHIGHTYTTIAADVLARFHRMIGDNTFFLTGTDEHGARIEEIAKSLAKEPKQFVDEIAAKFEFSWDEMNISNDRFIRTTEEEHKKAVQKALEYMHAKGDIYLGKYEALYCKGCEQYKSEKDLVDGKCPDHNTEPEKMSEESYMFKLSKYKEELLKKIENDDLHIQPVERKNEIVSFYKNEGLEDISFSRKKVKWGVILPWDEAHTAYVWADAILNYLTGLNWNGTGKKAPDRWPADVHLMSKDILRVHATIWPAMLLSLDLPLPKKLFIHGFFLVDGQKMSKSIGNVIAPTDLVKKYGVDATRYLLMSATTFGKDGDIGWKWFDEKYQADLANGIGNLVARTLTMTEKLRKDGGKLLSAPCPFTTNKILKPKELNTLYNELKIDEVLYDIWGLIRSCDKYIDDNKPWELLKNKPDKAGAVLYSCLEALRIIAVLTWPYMPETANKIYYQLGLGNIEKLKDFEKAIKWGGLKVDSKIERGEILFKRLG